MFPKYLEYEDENIRISIRLDSFKTFILGGSASGKTYFSEKLYKMKKYANLRQNIKLSIAWENLYVCLNEKDVDGVYSVRNSIIILDRLDFYMNEQLINFINDSNNIFILITRYGVPGVDTTHKNFKVLKLKTSGTKLLLETIEAFSPEGARLQVL